MATLSTLPNEILSMITGHLERPRDLLYLSLSSRRLSEFAKLDGWKAFLKGRLGIGGLDMDAQKSAHGMTTLYRNWHRKGFVARYLEPSAKPTCLNSWQPKAWRGPQGQTMGYQPSIDSYEELYGGWGERKEVLAWSAGTQIILRIRETGSIIEKIRKEEKASVQNFDDAWGYDSFRHLNSWFTYKIPDSFEGRDDIITLKLLRPHQRDLAYECIVFGTASGQLSLLSVSPDHAESFERQFETGGRAIGSTSISSSSAPILATTLGDSSLALFPIDQDRSLSNPINPLTHVTPKLTGARSGRIWSCNFLSDDKVVAGVGPSHEPIQVYGIAPDGISSEPLRTFNLEADCNSDDPSPQRSTSIYPILPVPCMANGGSEAGQVFLSGGYDGIVRLHDMRSPHGVDTMYWDPTNDSSIYSLALQGLERIVAGVSMHSMIKVFDLRLSGSHPYHSILLNSEPRRKSNGHNFASNKIIDNNKTKGLVSTISGGWNLYLNPRIPPKRDAYREDYWRGRDDSPVYSLSIPSYTSQNLYAGLEGAVQSLTFHSIADIHPDTMLSHGVTYLPDGDAIDIRSSFNPRGDILNLGMYEQGTEEGLGMQLLVQDDVTSFAAKSSERRKAVATKDLDERWKDLRNEGDRWARGDIPQEPRRGRGRGRAGRNRGRAR